MKAIPEYKREEFLAMQRTYAELRAKVKGLTRDQMFANYKVNTGYAHFKFRGTVTQQLIDCLGRMPTEDEIILLVDGYSHFGASCSISGMDFYGYWYYHTQRGQSDEAHHRLWLMGMLEKVIAWAYKHNEEFENDVLIPTR